MDDTKKTKWLLKTYENLPRKIYLNLIFQSEWFKISHYSSIKVCTYSTFSKNSTDVQGILRDHEIE